MIDFANEWARQVESLTFIKLCFACLFYFAAGAAFEWMFKFLRQREADLVSCVFYDAALFSVEITMPDSMQKMSIKKEITDCYIKSKSSMRK